MSSGECVASLCVVELRVAIDVLRSVDAYEQKYGVAIRVVHPSVDPASNKHENEDTPTLAQVQYAYQVCAIRRLQS